MNKLDLNYNLKKTARATARNNALCTLSNTEKNVVIDYSILQQLNLNNIAMEAIIEQLKTECNHFSNVGFFKVCSDEGVLNGGNNNYWMEYECIVINVRDDYKIKYKIIKIFAVRLQRKNFKTNDYMEAGKWRTDNFELYTPEIMI